MIEATQQNKKVWWIAAMMPLLFVFGKANAQNKKITKGKVSSVKSHNQKQVLGMILPEIKPVDIKAMALQSQKVLKGVVKDPKGNTIPFATISILNSFGNAISDSAGQFELSYKPSIDSFQIKASSIGYECNTTTFSKNSTPFIEIILEEKIFELYPVAVEALTGTVGGITMVKSITIRENIDTVIRKAFYNNAFKIYPNPVTKGSSVKLEIKKVGNYSIQLLDNTSKLILIKDVQILNEKSITEITIPSSLAAGMYYIRLIDENKKKQYTDKLIVQ